MPTFAQFTDITSAASFTLTANGQHGYVAEGVVVYGSVVVAASNPTGSTRLVNFGEIVGTDETVRTSGAGEFQVFNHGSITSTTSLALGGPATPTRYYIVNTGVIQGGAGVNGGFFEIENSGSMIGDVTHYGIAGFLKLNNSGLISGDIYGSSVGGDILINTGHVIGAVTLNAGADLFDGRGGRLQGSVNAGIGNDTLYGGLGADTLLGGDNDDTLYFDWEDLRFGNVSGGNGADTGYNLDNAAPLTVYLNVHSIEIYHGSSADEVVIGSFIQSAVRIFGGDGNDQIEGSFSGSNDTLGGDAGDDIVNGYGGNDSITGAFGKDYLIGGAGNDTVQGHQGDDTIFGGDDGDFSLDGGEGSDVIMGEGGEDTIYGGEGNDVWLDGGDGDDVIEGGAGDDLVRGEAGNDNWLNGGAGDDTIIGGAGADNLIGGAGADQFQFYSIADAGDTIFGFVSGQDKLFVAQSGFGQLTGFITGVAPAPINGGPHLLYNTTTGVLTYDANGVTAGGQTVLATLSGAPTLLYEDLLFV